MNNNAEFFCPAIALVSAVLPVLWVGYSPEQRLPVKSTVKGIGKFFFMVSQVFTYKYIFFVKDKAIILVIFCDYNNVEKRFYSVF
ncbi:hypothetical protein C7E23_05720 [Elizabethkingia anophelis]|nr:hypothetical protein C7E23_05720 [Elizabethkingia anophelis]